MLRSETVGPLDATLIAARYRLAALMAVANLILAVVFLYGRKQEWEYRRVRVLATVFIVSMVAYLPILHWAAAAP
jgi:uncharacterized membrane protein